MRFAASHGSWLIKPSEVRTTPAAAIKLQHEDIGVNTGSDTAGRIPDVLYGVISEAKSPAGYLALVQVASFALAICILTVSL